VGQQANHVRWQATDKWQATDQEKGMGRPITLRTAASAAVVGGRAATNGITDRGSPPRHGLPGDGGRGPTDRGSAPVWAVAVITAVLMVATAGVQVGAAMITRHRATAAADLAALGAAVDAVFGEDRACERATWVTEAMGSALVSCRLDGWEALVEVTARPPEPLARFGTASARARAGPAEN
jgi:secretion/DNA translocation related TadE-like protein